MSKTPILKTNVVGHAPGFPIPKPGVTPPACKPRIVGNAGQTDLKAAQPVKPNSGPDAVNGPTTTKL